MNQRTSGLVNPHLTPGPGIYFNAFIHVYSNPKAGADNPLGTNVDVNRNPYHFAHLLQVIKQSLHVLHVFPKIFKKKSLSTLILYTFFFFFFGFEICKFYSC